MACEYYIKTDLQNIPLYPDVALSFFTKPAVVLISAAQDDTDPPWDRANSTPG